MAADRKTLRKRERNAADVLMNNPAIRENLNDIQAELALNWSFDQIAALVDKTAALPDKKAEGQIDDLVDQLQANLKLLSQLTDSMPGCDDKLVATRDYQSFLTKLYGSKKNIPDYAKEMMEEFIEKTTSCSTEDSFSHFFAIIQKELEIQ